MKLSWFSLSFVISLPLHALAADVIAFGDSWLTVGRAQFAKVASERGFAVDNIAVGGTTTSYWSQDSNIRKIEAALDRSPEATHIIITNGGNDAQGSLPFGGTMEQLISDLNANTRKTLDAVFAKRPDIKVVQSGYDLWAWDKSVLCKTLGTALLSGECGPAGLSNVTCANIYAQRIHYEFVEQMDAEYSNFASLDLHGTLQAAGTLAEAVPGTAVGKPDLTKFTPGPYFNFDCIHLSPGGYTAYFNAMFDRLPQ